MSPTTTEAVRVVAYILGGVVAFLNAYWALANAASPQQKKSATVALILQVIALALFAATGHNWSK